MEVEGVPTCRADETPTGRTGHHPPERDSSASVGVLMRNVAKQTLVWSPTLSLREDECSHPEHSNGVVARVEARNRSEVSFDRVRRKIRGGG